MQNRVSAATSGAEMSEMSERDSGLPAQRCELWLVTLLASNVISEPFTLSVFVINPLRLCL